MHIYYIKNALSRTLRVGVRLISIYIFETCFYFFTSRLNQNIENLLIALDNGENVDIISNRITDKRNTLKKVKKQLEEEKEKIANLTEYEICFFLKELKNGNANSFKHRKLLVNLFVNKIYLYDKKMTIIFNVGKKKVTINTELIDEINTNLNKTSSLFFNNFGQPNKTLK